MRTSTLLICAAAVLALGAAGCGSNSKSSSGSGGSTTAAAQKPASSKLKVEADGDGGLYFEQKKLTAKSGAVTIAMENPKTTGKQHGIAVEGNGVDKDGPIVAPGKTATLRVSLKPGTYAFYCPFDGHEKAGMKGTLTVSGGSGGSASSSSSGGGSGSSGGGYGGY